MMGSAMVDLRTAVQTCFFVHTTLHIIQEPDPVGSVVHLLE